MGAGAMCLPCCLLLLACLIDVSDGGGGGGAGRAGGDLQKKRLQVSQLKHDVLLLEELAVNLEHEIEEFYEDNAHENLEPHPPPRPHSKRKHKHKHGNHRAHITPQAINITETISNEVNARLYENKMRHFTTPSPEPQHKSKVNVSDFYWPKFEEILSMNRRRYDWKNDRWIKLGKISPQLDESKLSKLASSRAEVDIHKIKHRFNYKRVRLDSGNAKGNIVIAVSAVR